MDALGPVTLMSIVLKSLASRPMARLRLVCIPFAGAGIAAFGKWTALLPDSIEPFVVQLPGREDRLRAAPFRSWHPMMESLITAASALPPLPTALFGHSLGAVIALELARHFHVTQPGRIRQLFVSGRPWPGTPGLHRLNPDSLDDDQLLAALDRAYGSGSSSLSHPDIREVMLPALRADLAVLDSHVYRRGPTLSCPLTVYGGDRDPGTTPASLDAWRAETSGPFRLVTFAGDHFFLDAHRADLVADIVATIGDTRQN
jgi:medium-chain acyl-[acyl-carrier-protein] hydrolase